MAERDGHLALSRHFAAQRADGIDQPERFQPGWVERVRQDAQIPRDLAGEERNPLEPDLLRTARDLPSDVIDLDVEERNLLSQVVMQVARDSLALFLLAGDQATGQRP